MKCGIGRDTGLVQGPKGQGQLDAVSKGGFPWQRDRNMHWRITVLPVLYFSWLIYACAGVHIGRTDDVFIILLDIEV